MRRWQSLSKGSNRDRRQASGIPANDRTACDGDNAFDVIAVHSYSRFFRDAFRQEFYFRKLPKQGVKLVSITQPLGDDDDPAQAMMRKIIALFDEYQSKKNASTCCAI
jgi:hypothetical protein